MVWTGLDELAQLGHLLPVVSLCVYLIVVIPQTIPLISCGVAASLCVWPAKSFRGEFMGYHTPIPKCDPEII